MGTEFKTGFGLALRNLRADLGLSQLALAGVLSTTQRHISFLETGRSLPSRGFVIRLSTELSLSLPQRAALFDAGGFDNPYRHRAFGSDEILHVLDMLERRLLAHWPFPGFVLDAEWRVLRANEAGAQMLAGMGAPANTPTSLFELFLSPGFRARLENWEEVSLIFYYRMQAAAAHSPDLAARFAAARCDGLFDHIPTQLAAPALPPAYVPAIFRGPDGTRLAMSSLVGKLASVHEAAIEGLEVELIMPVDEETEACLLASA